MAFKVLIVILFVALSGLAFIRFSPADPASWHQGLGAVWARFGPVPGAVREVEGGAIFVGDVPGSDGGAALARLDRVAMATARTRRLAGNVKEGRITWEARSAVFGFPDYTTAEVIGEGASAHLVIYGRQRFGRRDFGVNGARLRGWIAQAGAQQ